MAEDGSRRAPAPDSIEGFDLDGSAVRLDLSSGRRVLHFLTSSCRPCRAVWPHLGPGDVAVTPGPATESRQDVAALAPAEALVVMSSEAWFEFRAGPAPWRVELQDGIVIRAGSGQAGAQSVHGADDV
jgi:hypothetical protein